MKKPLPKTYLIGLTLIVASVLFLITDRISDSAFSNFFARKICGDKYLVEPDQTKASQGILTDRACGFNADMWSVAFAATAVFLGLVFLAVRFLILRKRAKAPPSG